MLVCHASFAAIAASRSGMLPAERRAFIGWSRRVLGRLLRETFSDASIDATPEELARASGQFRTHERDPKAHLHEVYEQLLKR